MTRELLNAFKATLLAFASLALWKTAYVLSDWAILALVPLAGALSFGAWSHSLGTWRARLHVTLKEDSPLGRILTGRIRATVHSMSFLIAALTTLAWLALSASPIEVAILLVAFVVSGAAASFAEFVLSRHFHPPFSRSIATNLATWGAGFLLTIVLSQYFWAVKSMPGALLDSELSQAVQIGLEQLPRQDGWIASIFSIPYAYEAVKIWLTVKLAAYPFVAVLLSFDMALYSFLLCHTAIILTHFCHDHLMRLPDDRS